MSVFGLCVWPLTSQINGFGLGAAKSGPGHYSTSLSSRDGMEDKREMDRTVDIRYKLHNILVASAPN